MYFITTKRMLEVCFSAHPNIQYRTVFLMLSCLLSPERLVTVPGSVIYWNKKEKAGGPAGGERLFHGWVQKQGCLENPVTVIEFQYAVIPFHQITHRGSTGAHVLPFG